MLLWVTLFAYLYGSLGYRSIRPCLLRAGRWVLREGSCSLRRCISCEERQFTQTFHGPRVVLACQIPPYMHRYSLRRSLIKSRLYYHQRPCAYLGACQPSRYLTVYFASVSPKNWYYSTVYFENLIINIYHWEFVHKLERKLACITLSLWKSVKSMTYCISINLYSQYIQP